LKSFRGPGNQLRWLKNLSGPGNRGAGVKRIMGLDMYLSKRTYVKNWSHMKPEERHEVSVTRNGSTVTAIKPERVSYIVEEVAYWRKANAIHDWFVKNCQDGVDECQESYVSREQLQELLDVVNAILAAPAGEERDRLAAETLPPVAGFFFGSTDIDEYYYEDLEFTQETLTELLAEPDEGERFIYQSSW
jgi:hypothetical protein